jgi:TonB family protein
MVLLLVGSARADDDVVAKWQSKMADTSTLLKTQQYRPALRNAKQLIDEMVERLGPGNPSTELFGTVLTYRALAHAGLGESEDAIWYWQTVLGLYPKFAESDVSMYGAAGEFLKAHVELPPVVQPQGGKESDFTWPKVKKKVKPKYPYGARYFGVSGKLLVEVVITADGRVERPRIVEPLPAPTLSYAALEAVKRWRFEPGKMRGTPFDVIFQLGVNYKD